MPTRSLLFLLVGGCAVDGSELEPPPCDGIRSEISRTEVLDGDFDVRDLIQQTAGDYAVDAVLLGDRSVLLEIDARQRGGVYRCDGSAEATATGSDPVDPIAFTRVDIGFTVGLMTEDGSFDEQVDGFLSATAEGGGEFRFRVDLDALRGDHEPQTESTHLSGAFWLAEDGTHGTLDEAIGDQAVLTVLAWPAAAL